MHTTYTISATDDLPAERWGLEIVYVGGRVVVDLSIDGHDQGEYSPEGVAEYARLRGGRASRHAGRIRRKIMTTARLL